MAESGIVTRYVFNNIEYLTYEEAKAKAESTVGGGHVYKRTENISLNQIKHWDYMQNPATYEDWVYNICDDEDMGFVDANLYLYFKLEKNSTDKTIGEYDHIELYDSYEKTTKIKDVYIGETFELKINEGFSFKFMNGETEVGTQYSRWLVDKNADVTTFATNKKVFLANDEDYYYYGELAKQVYYISVDGNSGRRPDTKYLLYGKLSETSFDSTYGYAPGSTVILTDSNTVSPSPSNEEEE